MRRTDYAVWGWLAGAMAACSSNGFVDIGDDSAQSDGQSTVPAWARRLPGTYSTDPPGGITVDPSLLQAGTVPRGCEQRQEPFNPTIRYRGYIQGFQGTGDWPSEVVILEFTELSSSAVSGRVLNSQTGTGNYAVPSHPMDCSRWCMEGAEGFQYTMTQGSFDGQRLRFSASRYEPMCAWCGQQMPFAGLNGQYGCVPSGGWSLSWDGCAILPAGTTEWQQWDCGAVTACAKAPMCACSADGCTAASDTLAFDLVMGGDQLTGPAGTLGNVVFTRETS